METPGTIYIVLMALGVIATFWLVLLKVKQFNTAKKALRVERARPVINAYEKFMGAVCQKRGFTDEELDGYWKAVHNDLPIFDKKRRRLLQEVYKKATELQFAKTQKESHRNDENDEKFQIYVKEEHELMSWFSERFGEIPQDFRRYL